MSSERTIRAAAWPITVGVTLLPVIWLVGIEFVWYHILALILLSRNWNAFRRIGPYDALFYLLIAVLGISLILSPTSVYGTPDRVVAALNNITLISVFYIVSVSTTHLVRQNKLTDGERAALMRSILRNVIAFVILSILAAGIWIWSSADRIWVPTLFGLVAPPMPGLLGEYQQATLIASDYPFGTKIPRSSMFATFSTTAAFVVASLSGIYLLAASLRQSPHDKVIRGFMPISIAAVAFTLSRASLFATVAAWLSAMLISRFRMLGLTAIIVTAIGLSWGVSNLFELLSEARPGSSATRFEGYSTSITMVMEASPLIGIGVKPRLDDLNIPIGSHSSVISFLVRGGILGASLGLLFFLGGPLMDAGRVILSYAAGRRRYGAPALLGAFFSAVFLVYFLVQDIDAYAVAAFVGGLYAGLLRAVANAPAPAP